MWTRLLFWKRKLNRIYTACPEIRQFIDLDSRNTCMNAVRLTMVSPVLVPFAVLTFCLMAASHASEWVSEEICKAISPLFGWAYRDISHVSEAHKILPPSEIRARIDDNQ